MTTVRKRWWRMAALAVVGGGVMTGGWYRFVRATPVEGHADAEQSWTRAATPPAPPPAVERAPEAAPPADAVTPAAACVPSGEVVAPAVPAGEPPAAAPATLSIPSIPTAPPVQQAGGPVQPDGGVVPASASLPTIPAVPAVPASDLPALPVPPKPPKPPKSLDIKPSTPAGDMVPKAPTIGAPTPAPVAAPPVLPALPGLPGATAEPPKATAVPPTPAMPAAPPMPPAIPQPPALAPSLPPAKPAEPVQPVAPSKPDSGLNAPKPGNTLNPTVPALPPVGGAGREAPATPVDRAKPPEPDLGASDKFVFPVPAPKPVDSHPRDDSMHKLTTAAAFAALSGALLSGERVNAFPAVPAPSSIPLPGARAKADNPDVDKLKKDVESANTRIADANKKIEELQKQVAKLTEQLNGRKDDKGLPLPSDPGAVAEIKQLKDTITKLEGQVKTLKTQTSLKPAVTQPEAKLTGIVKIINEYPVEVTMVVNSKSYRVAAGAALEVEVPAGDFTYRLLTADAPVTTSRIQKGETVRLRIK